MLFPDLNFRIHTRHEVFEEKVTHKVGVHDVIFVPEFCGYKDDYSLYKAILEEVSRVDEKKGVLVPWHGDNHLIANDRKQWKKDCPTFNMLIDSIAESFNLEVNATRLNLYRSDDRSSESKPYHHDRAAFTAGTTQNLTIAISLGVTRTVSLKRAKAKFGTKNKNPEGKWESLGDYRGAVVNFACPNNSLYAFARDVNIEWKHGVVPSYGEVTSEDRDRISIIVWGTKRDMNLHGSRVSAEQTPSFKELGTRAKNLRWNRHKNLNQHQGSSHA